MKTKYLIIGGGPSGTAAAEAVRRGDQEGSITIVDREGERLYSKIVFHLLLDGKISQENIYLKNEAFYKETKIDLVKDSAVSGDSANKTVSLDTGEVIEYEKLIIACGGGPRRLEVEGIENAQLQTFYSLSDVVLVKTDMAKGERVLVIGGGFLTIDLLDALVNLNKKIVLVMRDERILQNKTGVAGSDLLERNLIDKGVQIKKNTEVVKFENIDGVKRALLENGETVEFDSGVVAVGIEVNLDFAKSLNLSVDKGIIVDDHMRSSVADVFSCGDVCQYRDFISGDYNMAGNWYFALESGKVAGENATGGDAVCQATVLVAKQVFGCHLFFCGSINPSYQVKEFPSEGKYLEYYLKENKVVGIGGINVMQEIPNLRKKLGQIYQD